MEITKKMVEQSGVRHKFALELEAVSIMTDDLKQTEYQFLSVQFDSDQCCFYQEVSVVSITHSLFSHMHSPKISPTFKNKSPIKMSSQ